MSMNSMENIVIDRTQSELPKSPMSDAERSLIHFRLSDIRRKLYSDMDFFDHLPMSGHPLEAPVTLKARDVKLLLDLLSDPEMVESL